MPQEWDEKGNAVTSAQAWDEHGNPIATTMQEPQPIPRDSSIGPDTRGLLQKANDWWTRKPAYDSTLSSPGISPRERTQRIGQAAAVASIPAAGASLIAAPLATALGVGGGIAGAAGGGYAGKKAGEYFGAPELGEDIGGLAGGIFGGAAGGFTSPKLRAGLAKNLYAPNGELSEGAQALAHPLEKGPEYLMRKAIAPPEPTVAPAVSIRKSPNFDPFAYKQGATDRFAPPVPQGNETPFGRSFEPGGKIVDPTSKIPDVNRELTNYPRESLFEMAKKGDTAAIAELRRNPARWGLPTNSKYLIEK